MRDDAMIDRAWLEIDSQALLNNYHQIQKHVGRSKVMAVVKDLFYGLGADSILLLQEHGVDFFATATIQEAIELRQMGIDQDILILGYTHPNRFIELAQNDFHQTIVSLNYAQEIAEFSKRVRPIKTHLKVNTGMNRLGVHYEDKEEILKLYQNEHLTINGIFSHLLAADEYTAEADQMNKDQIERLDQTIDYLESHDINVGITHMYNSYGCLRFGDHPYDYCRPGLIFVGCPDAPDFQNCLTLKARVAMVKDVAKGQQIGYGIDHKMENNATVATITIGYGDGLERRLNQTGFQFSYKGKNLPLVGRMCMDQMMVDVSEVPELKEGDYVEVLNAEHDVYDMSKALNTIPNEVLTHLMSRLPRRSVNEELY